MSNSLQHRHEFSLTRYSWVRSSSLMSVEAIANGVISWQVYHRWFWSLKMQASTSFVENGQSIIRVLYVMRNQKLTNVRETKRLIRSNAVNIINPNHHFILLSWTIVSLVSEPVNGASERCGWANKLSDWDEKKSSRRRLVIQKPLGIQNMTDQWTDGWTYRQTNTARCRVACPQLKTQTTCLD